MDQRVLQGWHRDPFGQHELRYLSVGQPTNLVRDGGVEGYDEPPEGAAPSPAEALGGQAAATAGRDPFSPSPVMTPYAGGPPRRRRPGLPYALVALVSAAAVVAVVVVVAHGTIGGVHSTEPAGPGMNLAAFVTKSAKTTLAKKTADIHVRGTVEAAGAKVELHGNGQAGFAKSAVALNVSVNAAGETLTEREIITNQGLWLQLTMNGQSLGQIIGGKAWFEVPLTGQPVSNSLQENPVSSLQLLEQQGARVVAMGAQDVGGLTCNEYTVTPNKQALIAAAQRQWAKLGLSSSDTAAARQLVENSMPPTITIWIDPKQDLTCQLAFYMQLGTGSGLGSGPGSAPSTESVQLLMTFTRYGVPVNITPPPKSDTFQF